MGVDFLSISDRHIQMDADDHVSHDHLFSFGHSGGVAEDEDEQNGHHLSIKLDISN